MNNKFSENLKKIRKDNNLSQEQLAEKLGVSRQAISKWESAVAYPEMDKIIALCDNFNLNIDDLLHKDIREVKGEEESKNKLNKYIDDFLKYITDTINLFSNMNFKSKLKCLFEQVIIISILILLSLTITRLGCELFSDLFSFLSSDANHIINNVLQFILVAFCILLSIIILIHIFKTRYLNYYDKLKKEVSNTDDNTHEEINKNEKNKISLKNNEDRIIIRDPKHAEYRFISGLLKFIIGMFKSFLLCISLFLCIILILLFTAFIIFFVIYKTGLFFIGLLISILSISVITIILILVIFNFVFNRKNNKKKMIWSFIISLMVFGIGIGISFVGTLNFEILENTDIMLKTEIKEYEMQDDLLSDFHLHAPISYIESDIDNIKVEYKINKYCKIKDSKNDNYIYVWAVCSNSSKMIREFIDNFNNRKIIPINNDINSITIYASKENIEKLKNNYDNYINEQTKYDNTIYYYENSINNLENKVEDYENKILELEEKIENYKEQLQKR